MLRFGLQYWRRRLLQPGQLVLAALAYALFAIAPHDYFLNHEHAGGGLTHEHSVSSLHQANLERQVMATLNGATSEMEDHLSSTGEGETSVAAHQGSLAASESPAPSIPPYALTGAAGLKVPQSFAHGHFFSDANLVALVFVLSLFWVLLGKAAMPAWIFLASPSLRLLPAAARGPPRFV